jgi:hypothetical protein
MKKGGNGNSRNMSIAECPLYVVFFCISICRDAKKSFAHEVTSIKQSPILSGRLFLVQSLKISDELNLF